MKRLIKYGIFLSLTALLTSCGDNVDFEYGCTNPLAENYNAEATIDNGTCTGAVGCTDSTASNYDPLAAVNCGCKYNNVKRILIEDFTGHTCVNCPDAARKINDFVCQYGDKIIPIGIHTNFFAEPGPPPFDTDYRTPEGDEIATDLGVVAFPSGSINRLEINGVKVYDPAAWDGIVADIIDQPAEAKIEITTDFNASSSEVSINVSATALTDLSNGPYNLVVYITEDNLISAQEDHSGTVLDYKHKHVFRDAISTTFGDEVATGTISNGSTLSKSYTYTLNSEWIPANCHIVAFLAVADTKEVIQANQTYVTHTGD